MASGVETHIIEPIENVLDSVGLMHGPSAPLKRTAVGVGIGAAVVFGLRPAMFWTEPVSTNAAQKLRPWKLTSKDSDATWIPWYLFMGATGFVMGVLI